MGDENDCMDQGDQCDYREILGVSEEGIEFLEL